MISLAVTIILNGKSVKRLTDPSFRYTPSFRTDIRKTFRKVRKLLQQPKPKEAT